MHPAIASLPLEGKGLVLARLLARAPLGSEGLPVDGELARDCLAALEALAAEPKASRIATVAALIALLRAPVPSGIERVSGGWLRERLEGQSSVVIRAVVAGLPAEVIRIAAELLEARGEDPQGPAPSLEPAGVADLQRIVFGGLVPLAGPGAPVGRIADALVTLPASALGPAIEVRGAEVLGTSLRGAPGEVVARAAAGLGAPLADAVIAAAARESTPEARQRARAVVAAVGGAGSRSPRDIAWELGARSLAADMEAEGRGALRAVAQRLPPTRGRRLLEVAGA